MKMSRLVLAACLLAGTVPLRAQPQSDDGLDQYRKEIAARKLDNPNVQDKVKKGEFEGVSALCAMKELTTAARDLTEITFTYADAYDKAGGNEQAADDAAKAVVKKKAAQAARSAVWHAIWSKLPYKKAAKGVDKIQAAKGTVMQAVGVSMCGIVAQKIVREDFGHFASFGAAGEKMINFDGDKPFKAWIGDERAVTEQWLKEQNGGGDLTDYQKAFVKGYTDKLTSTYSDLKCTYYAFFTKAKVEVPDTEKTFCKETFKGKSPLLEGPAS